MAITYKQKCARCNKNYVTATWKTRYVLCYDCQKKELMGVVEDPKMKKLFNIPDDFYTESAFLRSIKINYLRYGDLSGDQIRAFKSVVQSFKDARAGKSPAKPKAEAAPKTKKPAKKASHKK
jgi:DNA-directed RNA polymerase subunit RPC12/RpoP